MSNGKGLNGWRAYTLWMAIAAVIVGLDQLTKLAIIRWVGLYEKVPITSFFNITHRQNTGAAFSFSESVTASTCCLRWRAWIAANNSRA